MKMYDYDYEDNQEERICVACSVAGCECDAISGCEDELSDKERAQACVENAYEAYRLHLDATVRDTDLLAIYRREYVNAVKYQLSL